MNSATELFEAIIASLIAAMGLIALALGAARWRSADRTPIWFGVVGCLYGLRLAGHSQLIQPALPESAWRHLDVFITYAIVVPVALFVESLFGPGWHSMLRRTWQVAAIYAVLAIGLDLFRGTPGGMLWLNAPMVLISGGIAAAHLAAHWWRGGWSREFRVAAAGGLLFVGAATYETLGGTIRLEHFALLAFMLSVGYLVVHRMLAAERSFVAVSRELEVAKQIQRSILPRGLPEVPGLCIAARYLPMTAVGGDFYDFDTEHAGRLGVIVADVAGHGVPAALVASMIKMAFAAELGRSDEPGQLLSSINRRLCGTFEGRYVTACCGFINVQDRTFRYASAGHPAPLLRRTDGCVEQLQEHGFLLAFDPNAHYSGTEVSLQPGDRLIFLTDGLLDASNVSEEFFGEARLGQLVKASSAGTPDQFVAEIFRALHRWVGPGKPLQDDVTLVVVDIDVEARCASSVSC